MALRSTPSSRRRVDGVEVDAMISTQVLGETRSLVPAGHRLLLLRNFGAILPDPQPIRFGKRSAGRPPVGHRRELVRADGALRRRARRDVVLRQRAPLQPPRGPAVQRRGLGARLCGSRCFPGLPAVFTIDKYYESILLPFVVPCCRVSPPREQGKPEFTSQRQI